MCDVPDVPGGSQAVKSEQDRAVREGCAGCARLREQQVQVRAVWLCGMWCVACGVWHGELSHFRPVLTHTCTTRLCCPESFGSLSCLHGRVVFSITTGAPPPRNPTGWLGGWVPA